MTDGEKARLREAFRMFQIATVKTRDNPAVSSMFAMTMQCLGWVLDEPVYREAFESTLHTLRTSGVTIDPERN